MKDLEDFQDFLTEHGAVVIEPSNPWEVIRFKTVNGVSVIYQKKTGALTFTGEGKEAYTAFKLAKPWRAVNVKRQNLKHKKQRLQERDGRGCFFCQIDPGLDKLTIEHLLNLSQGGTNNENNLCLACEPCNTAIGNWPLTKKMLWRDQKLNKKESEIVSQTAKTIYQLFVERFKHLHTLRLLSPGASKSELRQIVKAMGADV